MPLAGLREAQTGSIFYCSFGAVGLSCAGLLILRNTRKKALDIDGSCATYFAKASAIAGGLSLFAGLVLQSVPYLVGVASDAEGRAAALLQCTLVLCVWVSDCMINQEERDDLLWQTMLCVLVWVGTTLVQFAGPRPYDNMSVGFETQIAGCDGGYRSPFLCYASIWLGAILFGVLLMIVDTRHSEVFPLSCWRSQERPGKNVVSQVALPAFYAFTTSMSGLCFAVGSASGQLGLVFFGSLLIVLAVLSCWDCLWRVEMPLGTWIALSQALSSIAHLAQTHLAFRDLRWDPPHEVGLLIVKRANGLPLYIVGFFLLVVTLLIILYGILKLPTPDPDSGKQEPREEDEEEEDEEDMDVCRPWAILEMGALSMCIVCLALGLTLPMLETNFQPPAFVLGENTGRHGVGGHGTTPSARSLLQTISMAYTQQLPCTALVLVFQFIVVPPLQFFGSCMLIFKPSWFPKELHSTILLELKNQAPMRFTNPFLAVTFVGLFNLGLAENTGMIFRMAFSPGVYFMLGYAFASVVLVQLLESEAIGAQRREQVRQRRLRLETSRPVDHDGNTDSEDSEDDNWAADAHVNANKQRAAYVALLLPIVLFATYCAMERPFFSVQLRIANAVVDAIEPTMHQVYNELSTTFPLFGALALATGIGTLTFWSLTVAMRIPFAAGLRCDCFGLVDCRRIWKRTEQIVRPWVMTHVWGMCCFLLYYISWARNKAVVEVCVKLPSTLSGLVALGVVYLGLLQIFGFLNRMAKGPDAEHGSMEMFSLPLGRTVWTWGLGSTVVVIFGFLYLIGPSNPAGLQDFQDINNMLEALTPFAAHQLEKKLPHSSGDCLGRWEHLVKVGQADPADIKGIHRDCKGNRPLSQLVKGGANITVRWVEGLDTLVLKQLRVNPPAANSGGLQIWNLTVSAEFTGLHVWIKVVMGQKTWLDDYMCCDNPFHLQIRASAMCTNEHGFYSPIKMEVSKLDPFDFKSNTNYKDSWGNTVGIAVDYGKKDSVQAHVRQAFVDSVNNFRIIHPDGRETDPLDAMAIVLKRFISHNTGQKCPHYSPDSQ